MPFDDGIESDLRFLLLEVRKQAKASFSALKKPSEKKVEKLGNRDDYVDSMKKTIENKCYYYLNHEDSQNHSENYLRALIVTADHLERAADFLVSIGIQVQYIKNPECIDLNDIQKYYEVIDKTLDNIFTAFINVDIDLAQKICESEQIIDDYYLVSFHRIREVMYSGKDIDDMLTYLFIIRYLERVGDAFLKIGESIINTTIGEDMRLRQFKNFKKGLKENGVDISSDNFDYIPILNTRSGCTTARVEAYSKESKTLKKFLYKEGVKDKIKEEVDGMELWRKLYPDNVPKLLWHKSRKKHSTILVEYIEGVDLMSQLMNSNGRANHLPYLDLVNDTLVRIWKETLQREEVKSTFMKQFFRRKDDIAEVHHNIFEKEFVSDFKELTTQARKLEEQLVSKYSVMIHGDFNIDNVLLGGNGNIYFIDLHRSRLGDYVQDVSVFMVSNYRIPVHKNIVRSKLNDASVNLFERALEFSQSINDDTFEMRLGLGLFRSFITSTRFQFDAKLAERMLLKGYSVLKEILHCKKEKKQFVIRREHFLD